MRVSSDTVQFGRPQNRHIPHYSVAQHIAHPSQPAAPSVRHPIANLGRLSVPPRASDSSTPATMAAAAPPSADSNSSTSAAAPPADAERPAVTPFTAINEPFLQAVADTEARNWSFQKGDIGIEKFNKAISGFLNIFDALASPVITEIVRKDFRWKTNGLRNSAKRLRVENTRQLVRAELKSPPRFWAPSGIESLLWAHRILQFVEQLVDHLAIDPNCELKEACIKAYRATLAVRHPPMTKIIFEKALQLVPPRAQFIANLSHHSTATQDDYQISLIGMKDFLRAIRPHIEALRTLFDMEEIEDPHR